MVPSTGTNTTSTRPISLSWLGQRVVQMPEMGDAHVGHLVDEDRVAVAFGAAADPIADIGRHASTHVLEADVAAGRSGLGPQPRSMPDPGIGTVGVMRRMGGSW